MEKTLRRNLIACLLLVIAPLAATVAMAQPRFFPLNIPMRDGQSLAADLFSADTSVARPLIVIQTPYNKLFYRYTLGTPQASGTVLPFDSTHYNYLTVDWRGFYASSAAGSPGYDRGLDGYDIIEWAAGQHWCNGKIGTWGVSALGLIQFQTMKHHPPHLVCAMPMVKDYKNQYSNFYPGGVYKKEYTESLQQLGFLTTASILAHPTHDLFWTLSEAVTDYPESVAVPVLMVGGWFDHFPDDVLRAFEDIRQRGHPAFRSLHKIIVGPWLHARTEDTVQGAMSFPNAVGVVTTATQEFFDYCLRGIGNGYSSRPPVLYYQMGDDTWREAQSWSGIATRKDTLYFGFHQLQTAPVESTDVLGIAFNFDPRNPSPAIGGPRFNPSADDIPVGPQDQRFQVESRPDVLTYATAPLTAPMEIDGAPEVVLSVNSNRTDTDFSVRLCDVYPDGRSMLMTQGIRRLRFRDSYESPVLGNGYSVYRLSVNLGNLALTLQPGHALRLDISSSIYPQYDLNLNNGGAMYTAGDTLVAVNGVSIRSFVVIPTRIPTSVERGPAQHPVTAVLEQNWPNPFNATTTLRFTIAGVVALSGSEGPVTQVRLVVYDMLGREVALLVNERKGPGSYTATWNAAGVASGVYIYRLTANDDIQCKKMVILK
jgi:uncharacterized protein